VILSVSKNPKVKSCIVVLLCQLLYLWFCSWGCRIPHIQKLTPWFAFMSPFYTI
jgi:hypothetical protein